MIYIFLLLSILINFHFWSLNKELIHNNTDLKEKEAKTFSKYMQMYNEYLKLQKQTEK
jgi:hypothetical protein